MSSNEIEFELAIERQPDGTFRSLVLTSASGRTVAAPFEPPFGEDEVDPLLRGLASRAVGERAFREIGGADLDDAVMAVDPAAVGTTLFEALFRGAVRDALKESWGHARAMPDRLLRLRLRFGIGSGFPEHLAALPWELLYDPDARTFLALDPEIRLVRALDVPRASERRPLKRPLRFLVVMANTADQDPLGLQREWTALEREVSSSLIELVPFKDGSIKSLRDTLEQGEFVGLHFMGHGRFDAKHGRGELLFEENGVTQAVSGVQLATNLRGLPHLRWTVLNACHSGAQAAGGDADPLLGVASALLHSGQTAVVAMQTIMLDTAAIAFSRGLYRALAKGRGLEAAVYEGRLEVVNDQGESSVSWAVPALFMTPGAEAGLREIETDRDSPEGRGDRSWLHWAIRALLLAAGLIWMSLSCFSSFVPKQGVTNPSDESDATTGSTLPSDGGTTKREPDPEPAPPTPKIQPRTPAVPISAVVPGKVAIVVLDATSKQPDDDVAAAIETVLWEFGIDGLEAVAPQATAAFADPLMRGDVTRLPGDGQAPWGASYLLIVESTVESRSHGLLLTVRARLLTADGAVVARVQETHTGGAAGRSAALTQAAERCFRELSSTLKGAVDG